MPTPRKLRSRRPSWDFASSAMLFKALADPHRLAILAILARSDEDVCVCEFTADLPLNQPTVSHHLRLLREADLVTAERRGTWSYYRLKPGVRARIIAALRRVVPESDVA